MEGIPNRAERYKAAIEKRDDAHVVENFQNLGITEHDLLGKKTLDLGAGGGEFARWANRHGGDVTPIDLSIDPKEKKRLEATNTSYVIGDAMQLPFGDSSFDLILSNAAIPNTIGIGSDTGIAIDAIPAETHKRRLAAVRETVRVLKPGGEIRFAPVIRNERNTVWPERSISMEAMLAELKNNLELEFEEEPLKMDEKVGEAGLQDTWRIIIRKKQPNTGTASRVY